MHLETGGVVTSSSDVTSKEEMASEGLVWDLEFFRHSIKPSHKITEEVIMKNLQTVYSVQPCSGMSAHLFVTYTEAENQRDRWAEEVQSPITPCQGRSMNTQLVQVR